MDGTMVPSAGNIAALEYFTRNGGRFTMASGRFPSHFRETVKGLPINAPVAAVNGNVIYDLDTDRILWSNPMPDEVLLDVIRFVQSECRDIEKLSFNGVNDNYHFSPDEDKSAEEVLAAVRACEMAYPVMKLIAVQLPELSDSLRSRLEHAFPGLMFAQSWPQGLEMNMPSGGKGNAVAKLRELLGGRDVIHTVVCVGDYENDLSMIEYADIGYAVGNAIDKVKAAADRITVPCGQNAIAQIISDLEQ